MKLDYPLKDWESYITTQTFAEHEERRIKNGWTIYNGGIDKAVNTGVECYAPADGDVIYAQRNYGASGASNTGYGNLVKIKHIDGSESLCAHFRDILVREGEAVKRGQLIGHTDNTGTSTGPHIHFEYRINGVAIDPEPFFKDDIQPAPPVCYLSKTLTGMNLRYDPTVTASKVGFLPSSVVVQIIEEHPSGNDFWLRLSKHVWIARSYGGYTYMEKIT